ncbi:MAG: ParB/RepB/Spo0J family partition protein [Ferruginibacter sp.]
MLITNCLKVISHTTVLQCSIFITVRCSLNTVPEFLPKKQHQLLNQKNQVNMSNYQLLPLKKIVPDPNQPRKYYNEHDMDDLTASVKKNGVISSILVRPHKKGYMIVFGERRYRASVAAGLDTIPAVIKDLSNEGVLDMQIIENLQRSNVTPIEEAISFKSLHETQSFEDIALKVGKSIVYVANRVKLADLLPEFQNLLFYEKINLGIAFKICRLSEAKQNEILKELELPDKWMENKNFEIKDWSLKNALSESVTSLDDATFDISDPTLYEEAGACTVCKNNSACNKLLFPEFNTKAMCSDSVCYNIKTTRAYKAKVENLIQSDDSVFFISNSYHVDKEIKSQIEMIEDLGAPVLKTHQEFTIYEQPQPVPTWEEYLKENDHWSDDGEAYTEEELQDFITDTKDDYEREVSDAAEYELEYKNLVEQNLLRNAFVVAGSSKGKMVQIVLKHKNGDTNTFEPIDPIAAIKNEMSTIEERYTRSLVLDRINLYNSVVPEALKSFLVIDDERILSTDDHIAAILCIAHESYDLRKWLQDESILKLDDSGKHSYNSIFMYFIESLNALNKEKTGWNKIEYLFNQLVRRWFASKLYNKEIADYETDGRAAALFAIAQEFIPHTVDEHLLLNAANAEKRSSNKTKKIAALQKKIDEIKASNKAAKSKNKKAAA